MAIKKFLGNRFFGTEAEMNEYNAITGTIFIVKTGSGYKEYIRDGGEWKQISTLPHYIFLKEIPDEEKIPDPEEGSDGLNIPQTATFITSFTEGSEKITRQVTKTQTGEEIILFEEKETI